MKIKILVLIILALIVFTQCKQGKMDREKPKSVVINEKITTAWNDKDNIDSPAFWYSDSVKYLFATAKSSDVVVVYNAETGKEIKRIGISGKGKGELKRPNGIAVFKNFMFVVERDNARLQIFSIPEFKSLGVWGEGDLVKPYGIFVYGNGKKFNVLITDNYKTSEGKIPIANELNKRIWDFSFSYDGNKILLLNKRSFGDTTKTGMLKVVESIWGDTTNNNLLIADEDISENNVKVYDMDGKFKHLFDVKGIINTQPEGIVLFQCKNGEGFWIVTDQDYKNNYFNLFDRKTFKFLGRFKGKNTSNTDGVALTQKSFGKFSKGAFFAVNNDGGVAIFDVKEILDSLNINYYCVE